MSTSTEYKLEHPEIWNYLHEVPDPEIPVVNVVEMGIVRHVKEDEEGIVVSITPTYSGCPAMKEIETDILKKLQEKGARNPRVNTVLSPAWTTAWITPEARQKLKDYGIAPPDEETTSKAELMGIAKAIECPRCKSRDTRMMSQFGSTACKALYQCNECLEPFDYFKCI